MKLARRLWRLGQLAGPAECSGDSDWLVLFVEEGAERVVPDSICQRCGKPVSEHSAAARNNRKVWFIVGVSEDAVTGPTISRN